MAVTPIRDRTDTGRGKSVSKCPRTRGHIDMGHRPEVPVKDARDREQGTQDYVDVSAHTDGVVRVDLELRTG